MTVEDPPSPATVMAEAILAVVSSLPPPQARSIPLLNAGSDSLSESSAQAVVTLDPGCYDRLQLLTP